MSLVSCQYCQGKKKNVLNESNNLIFSIHVFAFQVLFSKRSKSVLPGILWESGFWWDILLKHKLLSLGVLKPAVRSIRDFGHS